MKIAFFDTHRFDRQAFDQANQDFQFPIEYLEPRLTRDTAALARGCPCICAFANDRLDAPALKTLKENGVVLVALRSAGYNHVDLAAARQLGLRVVRVPRYSPYAVAEHAVALLLTLNRKIHRAHDRIRELNFSLEGLVGFDIHGKTVGVVGTGKIGTVFSKILKGFGAHVLANDIDPNPELIALGVRYVDLPALYAQSDILSLHVPLTPKTFHLIDAQALGQMKKGVFLINTGRGALLDTPALIAALKSKNIGAAGLDVYEEEETVFFKDLSDTGIEDDVLARLLTFPNVLITSHQGFLTQEALQNIAKTTLQNVQDFEQGKALVNEVYVPE